MTQPRLSGEETSDTRFSIKCPKPFSLLGSDVDPLIIRRNVSKENGIDANLIEDIYPCTALQRNLFLSSLKTTGRYVLQNVLDISNLNVDRFCSAWESVVKETPILRTRIVQESCKGALQVVVKGNVQFIHGNDLQEYLKEDSSISTELGQPISRYGIVSDHSKRPRWFIWSIHHALYDGTSLSMIKQLVCQAYKNMMLEKQAPFNLFVQYLQVRDEIATREYWKSFFRDYQPAVFPSLPSNILEALPDTELRTHCLLHQALISDITLATLIRAAWALVTSYQIGSKDIVFGVTISGRHASVTGIERIVGPTIATVPVRVKIPSSTKTVASFLEDVQLTAAEMNLYEQAGIQEIAKVSNEARQACEFQTLLIVQPPSEVNVRMRDESEHWEVNAKVWTFNTNAITLNCFLSDDGGVGTVAIFDSRIIDSWRMERVLGQFSWAMQQLANTSPRQEFSKINFLPPIDRDSIWKWNKVVPTTTKTCIHEKIEDRMLLHPEYQAIHAWDGDFTYGDLSELSTRLAHYLMDLGVRPQKPEIIVPICFEKSRWTAVAILAVLKAGGAFVLLEPSQLESRLKSIIQSIQPVPVILTSETSFNLGTRLMVDGAASKVIAVKVDCPQIAAPYKGTEVLPSVSPDSLMYMVFTSGSTGTPKGVMIPHSSFSSALYHQLPSYSISTSSRVFDFMSYSFDVSLQNTLATFISGGCLCVPSDQERKDCLADAITRNAANFITLTPSVLRTLEPSSLPTIRTIILIGEALHRSDLVHWIERVKIINTYGPSECTTASTIGDKTNDLSLATRIGKGAGAVTWVVDADDHNILLPVGAVGELLLEGPILGRGYKDNASATSSAFIRNPRWLLRGAPRCSGRKGTLYKTGDLVHYNEDGSLTFVGRKDTQVKIRGQRVELGEVEHHVRACVTEAHDLVAEVILPTGQEITPILAVFMTGVNDAVFDETQSQKHEVNGNFGASVVLLPTEVEARLAEHLPSHMVPTVFFNITHLPMTASGKTDRKRLRELGSTFSSEQLAKLYTRSASHEEKRQPTTEIESKIQNICARVLGINLSSIGIDDNFFRLGGDSIAAMRFVGEARRAGIQFTVADVFRYPTIVSLAIRCSRQGVNNMAQKIDATRFALVPIPILEALLTESRITGLSDVSNIVDILPVTSSQYEYLLLPNKGIQHFFLDLGNNVSIETLKEACHTLMDNCAMLRTQFMLHEEKYWQITFRKFNISFTLIEVDDNDLSSSTSAIVDRARHSTVPLDSLYTSFTVLHNRSDDYRLLLQISHAQYDGISLPLIIKNLLDAYHGRPTKLHTEYSAYVNFVHQRKASASEFWSRLLKGASTTSITSVLRVSLPYKRESRLVKAERLITSPKLSNNVTVASLTTAAWAVILSRLSQKNDVVFGKLVSGRNGRLEGIENILGPCHNTVPVRVLVSEETTGLDILNSVQQQHLAIEEADCVDRSVLAKYLAGNQGIIFDSVVKHFGFSLKPSFIVDENNYQLQHIDSPLTTAKHVGVSSYSEADQLRLTIDARCEILDLDVASKLLSGLVDCIKHLTANSQQQLGSWTKTLDLPKAGPC